MTVLIESIKERIVLFQKAKQNTENIQLMNEYRRYRNKVVQLIRITKNNYYQNKILKNKDNLKHM